MSGRDRTSWLGEQGVGKRVDCSKNVTSVDTKYRCIRGITPITSLKSGVTEEDVLCGLS